MNSYTSMDSMFAGVLRELTAEQPTGSRNGQAREIFGWSGKLLNPRANLVLNPVRKLRGYYAAAELLWYLSRTDDIEMIKAYAPSYAKFADEDGKAHGAYGYRWQHNILLNNIYIDQLGLAITLLKEKPDTRQAVVSMWEPSDLYFAVGPLPKKDIPCTIAMQFKISNGKLNMAVFMRSNDAWLGLPYDVFCFTSIQQLVADEIGCSVGEYSHMVGSMHLYEKNYGKAVKSVGRFNSDGNLAEPFQNKYVDHMNMDLGIDAALDYESLARSGKPIADIALGMKEGTLLADCVAACWGHIEPKYHVSGLMSNSPLETLVIRDQEDKLNASN